MIGFVDTFKNTAGRRWEHISRWLIFEASEGDFDYRNFVDDISARFRLIRCNVIFIFTADLIGTSTANAEDINDMLFNDSASTAGASIIIFWSSPQWKARHDFIAALYLIICLLLYFDFIEPHWA